MFQDLDLNLKSNVILSTIERGSAKIASVALKDLVGGLEQPCY